MFQQSANADVTEMVVRLRGGVARPSIDDAPGSVVLVVDVVEEELVAIREAEVPFERRFLD